MRLTVTHADRERSVLLPVDDATTVAQLGAALGLDPTQVGGIDPDQAPFLPIAQTTLLSGAVVPPRRAPRPTPGTVRLEVVGGPFAGQCIALSGEEQFIVGSAAGAHLRIADPHLAEAHARVTLGALALGVTPEADRPTPLLALVEPSPGCPVYVNGALIEAPTRIAPIDLVQMGSSLLRIGIEPTPDADLAPDPQGMRAFNRPSRIRPSEAAPVVTLPGEKPED